MEKLACSFCPQDDRKNPIGDPQLSDPARLLSIWPPDPERAKSCTITLEEADEGPEIDMAVKEKSNIHTAVSLLEKDSPPTPQV